MLMRIVKEIDGYMYRRDFDRISNGELKQKRAKIQVRVYFFHPEASCNERFTDVKFSDFI